MPIKSQRPSIAEAGYPATYRAREVRALVRTIRNRQSVMVCGLGGSGKSHLLRFLSFHSTIVDQLGTSDVVRLYMDCNAAISNTAAGIFRTLLLETAPDSAAPTEASDALVALRNMLATHMVPNGRFVIVLDRCERIATAALPDVLDGLRHLRDYLNRQVSYVLGSRTPLAIASLSQEFDDLLIEPPVIWVGPLDHTDAQWNVQAILSEQGRDPDESIIDALIERSGGHPRLLRAVVLAWAEQQDDVGPDLVQRLLKDRQVYRICENLWRELDELSQRLVQQLAQGEKPSIPPEHPLRQYGLVRDNTHQQPVLTNPLLAAFVCASSVGAHIELTAMEQQLWELVHQQSGSLLRRNDLITAIYGTDPDGVNDEALTALVARLRRKIEQAGMGKLETVRGQGYRFIPVPGTNVRQ